MVNIPTTQRQFYDTQRKVSTLEVAAGAVQEVLGGVSDIYQDQQKIKMESLQSQAMYDMQQATNQWRVDNQRDPNNQEALSGLNDTYSNIMVGYRDKVDPMFRSYWDLQSNELKNRYKLQNQTWGFQQNQKNVETDINTSIASNYNLARSYGQGGDMASALVDFEKSYNQLLDYGSKNLGTETAAIMLSDYEDGYISEVVLGGAENDPYEAEKYLESVEIKSRLTPNSYRRLKNGISGMQSARDKEIYKNVVSDFYADPTEAGYNEIKRLKPDMSEAKDEKLRSMVDFMPDYSAITSSEGLEMANNLIADLVDADYENEEQKFDAILDAKRQLQIMNNTKTESGSSVLDASDYKKNSQKIADIMQNDLLLNSYKEVSGSMSDLNIMVKSFKPSIKDVVNPLGYIDDVYNVSRSVASQYSKAVKIADDASNMASSLLDKGDVDGAKKVLLEGSKKLIWLRNPEFKDANIGDLRTVDGVVYKVEGYDKDIIVRRVIK